ncbi:MAG: Stage 0 sporulation protein J [Fimbriimonadales bacterium]|nr:Stage 0 sporulation protein J [Fimbriimonadales bacterium]
MRRGLGKGLSQLLGEQQRSDGVREVAVEALVPNPSQPRRTFDEASLRELADSIRHVGLLQPIIVRPMDQGRYLILAGERRWRAAKLAGLTEVPVTVRSATTQETMEIALIENLQREDISPLDAAAAYQALITQFGLTQDDVAQRVGKSRPTIANALRLLRLPEPILRSLASGQITEGHARTLLQFDTATEQLAVHDLILERGLSVREIEQLARQRSTRARGAEAKPQTPTPLESALSERLGAPCKIVSRNGRGRIEVTFFGEEDLTRIIELLGVRIDT